MKNIPKPKQGEYPEYFEKYYSNLPADANLLALLTQSNMDTIDVVTSVDEETLQFRYAEGKWSIREIIQHLMDSERVFAYRAMRIARGDKSENPGYDENEYAANSFADDRNIMDMVREFSLLRASTIELFKSLN
ncbi:MAG: DinB family protein, partial [Bacteroidia bacterium]|nr:DinB family protein [Bacteroidia bacterium]